MNCPLLIALGVGFELDNKERYWYDRSYLNRRLRNHGCIIDAYHDLGNLFVAEFLFLIQDFIVCESKGFTRSDGPYLGATTTGVF